MTGLMMILKLVYGMIVACQLLLPPASMTGGR